MRIAEIYCSDQGEGLLTGTRSVFVRASGCNLRCQYCDTPFTSWNPEGVDRSVDEIVQAVVEYDCEHVVLTGGEPMLFAELIPICEQLSDAGCHLTIETAGTLELPVVCHLMSISPKTANSAPDAGMHPRWHRRHERARYAPHVLDRLTSDYEYQLKFVVSGPGDFAEIEQLLKRHPSIQRDRVMMMPEGTDVGVLQERATWLSPACDERGFTFCPRKHIEWYGMARQT